MHRFFQFTLDLFDTQPPADVTRKPLTPNAGQSDQPGGGTSSGAMSPHFNKILPNQALAPVSSGLGATEIIVRPSRDPVVFGLLQTAGNDVPSAGSQTAANVQTAGLVATPVLLTEKPLQTLLPASFMHPQATREIVLDGVQVEYELKRGKRRTIGFTVGHEGLAVRAPKWVTLADVDKAVREKSAWIVKKLQETRTRHESIESRRVEWKDGAVIRFMGRDVRIELHPSPPMSNAQRAMGKRNSRTADKTHLVTSDGMGLDALHVDVAHHANAEQIRNLVQAWLMRQASQLFIERLDHFKPTLGVHWKTMSLSNATTRWGSASADGSIRLNWRLIHFRLEVIDYVVVHELSHLRVMDHSPRFWETVRSVIPDYATLRAILKAEAIARW